MSWLGDLSPTPNPREGNPHLGHDNLNSLPSKCLPAGAGQSQDRVWGFTSSLFLISFGEAYKMPLTEWVTKMNQVPGAPSQEREFCHEQTGGSPAAVTGAQQFARWEGGGTLAPRRSLECPEWGQHT